MQLNNKLLQKQVPFSLSQLSKNNKLSISPLDVDFWFLVMCAQSVAVANRNNHFGYTLGKTFKTTFKK